MRACACYLYEHASLNDSQRGGRGHCMDEHTTCIKYLVSTSCHAHMSACKTEGTPWYYGGFCASTFLFARGTIFNRTAKPLLFRFSSIKYQHGWITSIGLLAMGRTDRQDGQDGRKHCESRASIMSSSIGLLAMGRTDRQDGRMETL